MKVPFRTRVAARAGQAVARVSRLAGTGGGSVIGGRVTLALDPRALEHMAAGLRIALVSGTNGKTTTTRLLAAALESQGPVKTNSAGANLLPGLVSTLSTDGPAVSAAVLEVDEGLLPKAMAALRPEAVLLLNLSRDQLDRIGEVRVHAQKWRAALEAAPGITAIANADDPLVTWAATGAQRATWVATGQRWRSDAASCPACGDRIQWSPDGSWRCAAGDLARPEPDVVLEGGAVTVAGGSRVELGLELPGWANQANAAMAVAGAAVFGVDPSAATGRMRQVTTVAGRYEVVDVHGTKVRLLLAKNPAGWAEALDFIRPAPLPVVIGINARIADGRDPSWLWDVPFERLAGRFVVATGDRGRDLAVRLRYAEVDHDFVPGYGAAVRAAAGALPQASAGTVAGEVDLAANYTAFQDARAELGRGR